MNWNEYLLKIHQSIDIRDHLYIEEGITKDILKDLIML